MNVFGLENPLLGIDSLANANQAINSRLRSRCQRGRKKTTPYGIFLVNFNETSSFYPVPDFFIDTNENTVIIIPYGTIWMRDMDNDEIQYGVVRNSTELGKLARAHRKSRAMPLEKIAGLGNLGIRFLSEFERGKETAEIGKVLKALQTLGLEVVIQPRRIHAKGNELKPSVRSEES